MNNKFLFLPLLLKDQKFWQVTKTLKQQNMNHFHFDLQFPRDVSFNENSHVKYLLKFTKEPTSQCECPQIISKFDPFVDQNVSNFN